MTDFNKAEFIYSAGLSKQLRECDKPEVVFSGRSNVGKSSLINKLTNRKSLARVSATPGKTATINFFDVDTFSLVDLPGYGYAKVSKIEKQRWAELIEGYFAQNRNICLVVQIVDMRHPPTKDDMDMIDFLFSNGYPFIIVLTKLDKLNKTQKEERIESLMYELSDYEGTMLFPFSAVTAEGADEIKETIDKAVNDYINEE